MNTPLSIEDARRHASAILVEVERAVIGKREVLELVLGGLLANGHLLLEDLPGVAKTLIARSFAEAIGLQFTRVQFTPDLMPADITGSSIFDPRTTAFEFRPGPIFSNVVLGDEINRASPKTQAALLEAMQERQVTIDGETHHLEAPFIVLATQNPIEFEGTYPLPEAQLDRFMLRVSVGYPDADAEWAVLARRMQRRETDLRLHSVVDREVFLGMQRSLEDVHVAESIGRYIVALVGATRTRTTIEVGSSPRGSMAVLLTARARAMFEGRDFVVPEDVKAVAVPALAHRLRLRPDLWIRGTRTEDVIVECLAEVAAPAPTADLRT
jgi:MoxR-like ATPase